MGENPPAPPAGMAWAHVEALIKCNGTINCSPDVSSLKILGSSGKSYDVSRTFTITPVFGPDGYTSGQVWGYLEFAVPTSEQQLRLTLTQGNQTIIFALQ